MTDQRKNLPIVDEQLTYNLIQEIRNRTDISYEKSKNVLCVVLSQLEDLLPDQTSQSVIQQLLSYIPKSEQVDAEVLDCTEDSSILQNVLTQLVEIKEAWQQRSWQLYEDEEIILSLSRKLLNLLSDADSAICNRVLSRYDYSSVECLIEYYQMETRWSIRSVLLQVFGAMCSINATIITIFLNSVLPQELARDIRSTYGQNSERVLHSTLLLSMIFSMGESMPLSHFDQLGLDFINWILDLIENVETEDEEIASDNFLSFLLAYNLQFKIPDPARQQVEPETNNLILECFQSRSQANVFTSKILLMFNREEDPVRIFDHTPAPPHSVLKMFVDLFTNPHSASLFYTNDVKVVIDILVRQISDLSSEEPNRTLYLEICKAVLSNCNYESHRHRNEDLIKCFHRIQEEVSPCERDIQLVKEILESMNR